MKRFIIFLFIGGFLLCVFFACRGFIKSKQEKEKFIKYAISKQDFEILSDLGYCDETGRKDEKRVPFRDKILQNAYLENQDIIYYIYLYMCYFNFNLMILAICLLKKYKIYYQYHINLQIMQNLILNKF